MFHVAECKSFRVDSFKTPTVLNLFVCVPLRASHPYLYSWAVLFQAANLAHFTYVALNVSDLPRHSFRPTIPVE